MLAATTKLTTDASTVVSPVKVLHVVPSVARRYGGPSEVACSLVTALNQGSAVQAEVATTDADGAGGRLAADDVPAGVPVHMFHRNFSEQWKVSLGLRNWLRRHAHDYDLIHVHAVWSFAAVAAARAAQRDGVPYILRPAGMLSEYSWRRQGWKKRLYWGLVERRTIQRAAAFHVTSDAEAAEVRAVRPDARLFVIPNGVDNAAFSQPADPGLLRRRCGPVADGRPILLFLSRLHPKKGLVDLLLPAVAATRSPCFLAIVGGEDPHAPGYASEVRRAIQRHGLTQRVALLGSVHGDERWAMYDGADVFVLPSHSENFGVVVAEAMARGCSVVVTDAVQSCEHVRAAGAGDVVSSDIGGLAATLDRLISKVELRRACGDAGRAYASRRFRWEQIVIQIQRMYEDCLGGC